MKILCLSWKDTKHPKAGGAEVVIHQYLAGLVRQGHEVVQVATGFADSDQYTQIDGVQIHRRASIHSIYFVFWAIYLREYRGQYDVIIDHAGGIPLLSPVYVWDKPIVFVTHHIGTKERSEYFRQWMGMGWIGDVCRWIYNHGVINLYRHKNTITVSQGTATELAKLGFDHVTVLPNTTNYPRITQVIPKDLVLTVVGRVVPNKQFGHAIEVIHRLHQEGLYYRLNIVGVEQDMIESRKLHDLVQQYELSDHVVFHGKVSDHELIAIRDDTQYGLIVSDKEGFGMTVLEANSRGVPMIGYNISGVNEVIHHGINGYLIEKNNIDKVVDCIVGQDNYDQLTQSTINFIQDYPTWDVNISKLDSIII